LQDQPEAPFADPVERRLADPVAGAPVAIIAAMSGT
jgi:hypothetical protein